jgi:hypothetical protein
MSGPPRNRIVINLSESLNQQPGVPGRVPAARMVRPRRWPKVLAVLAVAFLMISIMLAAGGFFWWRHYQTTATYSLALIVDAAQRNDMASVKRLVDSEKVVQSLWPQVTQKATSNLGVLSIPGVQDQLDSLAPTVLPRIKDGFEQRLAEEVKDFSSRSSPKPFILLALSLPALVSVTGDDHNAHVATKIRNDAVELTMQKDGDFWKIVGLKDDALVDRLIEEFVKKVPAPSLFDAVEPRKSNKRRRR